MSFTFIMSIRFKVSKSKADRHYFRIGDNDVFLCSLMKREMLAGEFVQMESEDTLSSAIFENIYFPNIKNNIFKMSYLHQLYNQTQVKGNI